MPYIKKSEREKFRIILDNFGKLNITSIGEFNYLISSMLVIMIKRVKPDYYFYNNLIGVLECIKLELYRRAITPYENSKCETNGDLFLTKD